MDMEKILISLFGILAASLLGFRLWLVKTKHERMIDAGEKVYDILFPIIDHLKSKNSDAIKVIGGSIDEQRKVVFNLKRHLPFFKAKKLEQAWNQYLYHPSNYNLLFIEQYADCGSLNKRKEIRPILISRIEKILIYCKH